LAGRKNEKAALPGDFSIRILSFSAGFPSFSFFFPDSPTCVVFIRYFADGALAHSFNWCCCLFQLRLVIVPIKLFPNSIDTFSYIRQSRLNDSI
jgi:hypothetical protein